MGTGIEFAIFENFAVAIALAALVGLERERQRIKSHAQSFGGIRTFPLIALLGALSSYFLEFSELFSALMFAAFAGFMIVSYFLSSRFTKTVGLTSELAALLIFGIGFIAARGQYFLATALTLILMLFLHMKDPLHLLARAVNKQELQDTLKFMVIAFVILPLLPNQNFGPLDAFNPYITWLMVVFITGISFVSYLAVKFVGPKKGIGLTGFLAGLISSTALALSFSEQSKNNQKIVNPFVFAMLIASSAMFFRVLFEVFVLSRELLVPLLFPMVTMGVIGIVAAFLFWIKEDPEADKLKKNALSMQSPFQLKPALKFGVFFALILFVSKLSVKYFSDEGLYLISFVSGLMDVDAITVSVAQLANNGLDKKVATLAITIAAITNTFVKAAMFFLFGNKIIAKKITLVFLIMLIAGVGTNFLV